MNPLRYLVPTNPYLATREARRDLDLDLPLIERVAHAMEERDGIVLTCIDKGGIESIGYHRGEPNDLAQALKVLHGQYSAAHNARHNERAPWRYDRYRDTALHTDEVILDRVRELLFRPGARVLIQGRFLFDGDTFLLRHELACLSVDDDLLDAFIAEVQQTWAELQANPKRRRRRVERPRLMTPDEFFARELYRQLKAQAIARYRVAATAWRAGDWNAVVPREMFAPHIMAAGEVEGEIPPLIPVPDE